MDNKKLAMMLMKVKPYLAVIFVQFGYAGMSIITKFALNNGMDQHVFVVYRHVVATIAIAPFALIFERRRPKMTINVFVKIVILGLLEPVIDQNLYYTGMTYTTATFTSAMCNVLPAFAFIMACLCRLEKVRLRSIHSQAKIVGTIVTVGGAMLMTLFKGTVIDLPWAHQSGATSAATSAGSDPIRGAIMIMFGCLCWAAFVVLQAITLKSYPAELSLTTLICFMGALESSVFTIALEGGIKSSWSIKFDSVLLASVYSGVICSAIGYYIQAVVMKTKGPVFVTAFNPLSMIITAILGSLFLKEIMYLGRIMGAMVIVAGLYLVLWGKSKDEPLVDKEKPVLSTGDDVGVIPVSSTPGNREIPLYVTVDIKKVRPTEEAV